MNGPHFLGWHQRPSTIERGVSSEGSEATILLFSGKQVPVVSVQSVTIRRPSPLLVLALKMKGFQSAALLCAVLMTAMRDSQGAKSMRVVSPLKALTIWDPETKEIEATTPRKAFLPVFRARLEAEAQARKELKEKRTAEVQASATASGSDWSKNAARAERRRQLAEERYVEEASDRAAEATAASLRAASKKQKKNPNKYQFVGVVNPKVSDKPIKWYAREKPTGAKWSVRLVHVDQAAVVTDLFRRGEVDIFATYKNTGKMNEETNTPIIESEYSVRERSFK
jgi:hypothetical protein